MSLAITGTLVLSDAEALNANNPIIGYRNLLADGTLTASSEAADGYAENAIDGSTTDFWTPTALSATLEVQLSTGQAADYAAIDAHNLGDCSASVYIERHTGSAWETVASGSPGDNKCIAFLFDEVTASRWRLRIEGSTPPSIGAVHIGKSLQLQRKIYQGHTPIRFAETARLLVNTSETGQLMGNSVIRYGARGAISLKNLTAAWVRSDLEPFRKHFNKGKPFFWLWRPSDYPTEVAYCWRDGGELVPTNTGPKDFMGCTMNIRAYVDQELADG